MVPDEYNWFVVWGWASFVANVVIICCLPVLALLAFWRVAAGRKSIAIDEAKRRRDVVDALHRLK